MTIVKWKKPSSNGQANNSLILNSPFSSLFENFLGEEFFTPEYASFVPAMNVIEEGNKFHVELSAPGFEKSDLKIELEKGVLVVSGEHKTEQETNEKNYSRKEFNYGSFQRRLVLPEGINTDAIEAKYENGILKLDIPKIEKSNDSLSKHILIA